MALLGKIRSKSVILVLIIGLALFSFIISGALGTGNGDSEFSEPIGIVNDEDIRTDYFRYLVEQTEKSYNYTSMQAVNAVWDQMVREIVFQQQYDKLGIDAGVDQIEQVVSSEPQITSNPEFTNEAGFFDFGLFIDYIATLKSNNPQAYAQWKNQENQLIESAKQVIFFDLIAAGETLDEANAKVLYQLENNNVDIDYVKVPFSSVPDSLVSVSEKEIDDYINKFPKRYKRQSTRSLQYVSFQDVATEEDEAIIRLSLDSLKQTRIEYNEISKLTDTLYGFADTKENYEFIERNSDVLFDSIYVPKSKLANEFADILYDLEEGEIFGPYKDIGSYKISKLLDRKKEASIRANQILVTYQGAQNANPEVTRTKSEAEALAKEYLAEVKKDRSRLQLLASQYSDDYTKTRAGDMGFFQEEFMDPDIFAYADSNSVGHLDLLETPYGFHIIEITDKGDLLLFADVTREIAPSELTSNKTFKQATTFELEVSKSDDFAAVAEQDNYLVRNVPNITSLEENLPGLYNQRYIVQWAFDEETKLGAVKRFSLSSGGYVIVKLTNKKENGLVNATSVRSLVKSKLINEKKAAIIRKNNSNEKTLEDFATKNNAEIVSALALNQANSILVSAGNEPKVIGAAFGLKEGATSSLIEGNVGVFKIRVKGKREAEELENYSAVMSQANLQELQEMPNQVIEALETSAEVEDNRAIFY